MNQYKGRMVASMAAVEKKKKQIGFSRTCSNTFYIQYNVVVLSLFILINYLFTFRLIVGMLMFYVRQLNFCHTDSARVFVKCTAIMERITISVFTILRNYLYLYSLWQLFYKIRGNVLRDYSDVFVRHFIMMSAQTTMFLLTDFVECGTLSF